jgi:hypothetical protein
MAPLIKKHSFYRHYNIEVLSDLHFSLNHPPKSVHWYTENIKKYNNSYVYVDILSFSILIFPLT